jgi:hypothetical protein
MTLIKGQRQTSKEAQKKYNDKRRARYLAQPAEYREQFNWQGRPFGPIRKAVLETSRLIRTTTKYRTLKEVRSAVLRGEIAWESLSPQLQQRIPAGTGRGRTKLWRHKIHYGESLNQMGQRLGITREAVRRRIQRWGSPENSARPYQEGQRKNAVTPNFISARMLRVWGYDSITQLAQQPDSELLGLWSFGHRRLAKLRQLYPIENKANTDKVAV